MRLKRIAPLTLAVFALTPACGDDDSDQHQGNNGGAAGSSAGASAAGSSGSAGSATGGSAGTGGSNASAGTGGAEDAAGAGGMSGAGGEANPVDCSKLVKAPAAFTTLSGFTGSEDFAFDSLGNYVGVDSNQNLVRISKAGKKELWAPNTGVSAGMAMLPDGSLIGADVGNGALKRVYPNGASEVVIGGLLYPNGLDIGPDGFVYVAENAAGRVRRVNPDNGEFTIVAMGLQGPNGVAFSDDPKLLYVGSFEGSGVYKVEIPAPGQLGKASVFARPNGSMLEEPKLACPDQKVGESCLVTSGDGAPGKCRQLSNVVDCMPVSVCDDQPNGSDCGDNGTCKDGLCIPKPCEGQDCVPPDPCDGKQAGDDCSFEFPGGSGTCVSVGGGLVCVPQSPCEGKPDGSTCDEFGLEGTCQQGVCTHSACDGQSAGDLCVSDSGESGVCTSQGQGPLVCVTPCDGKPQGASCEQAEVAGQCFQGACAVTCTEDTQNLPCVTDGALGYCAMNESGPVCEDTVLDGPGGIDGMGVDACGNVYAAEFQTGNVWRISPAGEVEKLAKLPSSWIPNIKWGRGVGGFEKDVMYVADRNGEGLFGFALGVPGVTEYYDLKSAP